MKYNYLYFLSNSCYGKIITVSIKFNTEKKQNKHKCVNVEATLLIKLLRAIPHKS